MSTPVPSTGQPSALAKHLRRRLADDPALLYQIGPGSETWRLLAEECGGTKELAAFIGAHQRARPHAEDFLRVAGSLVRAAYAYGLDDIAPLLLNLVQDHATVEAAFAVLWSRR